MADGQVLLAARVFVAAVAAERAFFEEGVEEAPDDGEVGGDDAEVEFDVAYLSI